MRIAKLAIGRVTLARVESTGHDIALDEGGRTTVLVPLDGRVGIDGKGTPLDAGSGGLLHVGSGFRTTRVRPGPARRFRAAVALVPEAPAGRHVAHRMAGRAFPSAAGDARASALRGFLRYLLGELEQPESPLARPPALRAAEALILDLTAQLAPAERGGSIAGLSEARVRVAEEIMHARYEEPLTVEVLANEIGVGRRSLQQAFRAARGASPRAVLSAMRLDRARERLLAAAPGATVTEVALDCGFAHLGRFAAAYRDRFGESPAETLRGGCR